MIPRHKKNNFKFVSNPPAQFARACFDDFNRMPAIKNESFCDGSAAGGQGQEKSSGPSPASWKIERVQQISPFYHLERSHKYISEKSPFMVSSLISECLKKEFAIVHYDNIQVSTCF